MKTLFLIMILMLYAMQATAINIQSRVNESDPPVVSITVRSAHDFEKNISLKVGVDPKKINPERVAKILNSVVITDWHGNVIPGGDYDLDANIIIGYGEGSIEVIRVTDGEYPKIIAVFRDEHGNLINPDPNLIGAVTFNNEPICMDVQPIGDSHVSVLVDLIIDKSGSMWNVMGEAKQAARELVDVLPETAQCQIKAAAGITVNLTPNGFENCRTVVDVVDQLEAMGSTDLYSPLKQSYEYFNDEIDPSPGEVDKTVILLTDGEVNQSLELKDQLKVLKGDTRTLVYYIGNYEEKYFKELADGYVKGSSRPTGEIKNFLAAIGKSIKYQHVLSTKPCNT